MKNKYDLQLTPLQIKEVSYSNIVEVLDNAIKTVKQIPTPVQRILMFDTDSFKIFVEACGLDKISGNINKQNLTARTIINAAV